MILTGGRVVVPGAPPAAALLVRAGRVVLTGSDAEVRDAGAGEPEVDLDGRLVTPAFVDAHLHAVQTGQVAVGLDLHDVPSLADLLERVRRYVARPDRPDVVFGQGWDERSWPEQRPPTRAELDEAAGPVPTYLARVDVHSAVVSTALLSRLPDVSEATGYRPDGWLSQEAHHRCRGLMHTLFTDAERRTAASTTLRTAAAHGVGEVHELGGPHLGPLADLVRVREAGEHLGLRVLTYWGELADEAAFARAREVGARGLAGDLCVDGAIGSHTASLHADYADHPDRGVRYLGDDEIAAHVVACTRAEVQAGFHCIGDDAVAAAVRGLVSATRTLGREAVRAARHRLEHVEMVDAGDLATLADLRVTASVQPGFDAEWGGPGFLYDQRLGPRSAAMNPFASMHRAGVPLALGTDAPVTPLAGWAMVAQAVGHWRPDERMSVAAAFDAATRGGHRAGLVDDAGLLVAGARADLAVWDAEPAACDPVTGLPRLEPGTARPSCVATLVDGAVVFEAGALRLG